MVFRSKKSGGRKSAKKIEADQEDGLAYRNRTFLESDPGRPVRILSEFLAPDVVLQRSSIDDTIVFFGSARTLSKKEVKKRLLAAKNPAETQRLKRLSLVAEYYDAAHDLGKRFGVWAKRQTGRRYAICTGGGPGIMEAGNRGASDLGIPSIGFNIQLPFEQHPNPYISPELNLQFRYFFIRKFWFLFKARALIVFPGGFGTLDEMFEALTLIQTHKLHESIPVVLFGEEYWKKLVNWQFLIDTGMINAEDLKIFKMTSDIDEAFSYVTKILEKHPNGDSATGVHDFCLRK